MYFLLKLIFTIIIVALSLVSVSLFHTSYAEESTLPEWVRNVFLWYGQNEISEVDLLQAIQYLVTEGIIMIDDTDSSTENTDYEMISDTPYIKPQPYLAKASSPFYLLMNDNQNFTLVDFDTPLNKNEVTSLYDSWASHESRNGLTDSVTDGPKGNSYVVPGNIAAFEFHKDINNNLPTHVGIVFTDNICYRSGGIGLLTFQAFGSDELPFESNISEEVGDEYTNGKPDDDVFFGVVDTDGISKISMTMSPCDNQNMEFDHLQYGR